MYYILSAKTLELIHYWCLILVSCPDWGTQTRRLDHQNNELIGTTLNAKKLRPRS